MVLVVNIGREELVRLLLDGERDFSKARIQSDTDLRRHSRVLNQYFERQKESLREEPLNFSNTTFSYADLRELRIPYLRARRTKFSKCKIQGTRFLCSDFTDAKFISTRMKSTEFRSSLLDRTTMQDCDLQRTSFENSVLRGIQGLETCTSLDEALFEKARLDTPPNEYVIEEQSLTPDESWINITPQQKDARRILYHLLSIPAIDDATKEKEISKRINDAFKTADLEFLTQKHHNRTIKYFFTPSPEQYSYDLVLPKFGIYTPETKKFELNLGIDFVKINGGRHPVMKISRKEIITPENIERTVKDLILEAVGRNNYTQSRTNLNVYEGNEEDFTLSSQLKGEIPERVNKEIEKSRQIFGNNIYFISEIDEWKTNSESRKNNPLIAIGLHNEVPYMITGFNADRSQVW